MSYSPLPQRGILKLSGTDTETFLQGLISNDIRRLNRDQVLYAAMLSAQGKYLHDFFLFQLADGIALDCDQRRTDDLLRRLTGYRLRSKVVIEPMQNWRIAACWSAPEPSGLPYVVKDPRYDRLGWRMLAPKDDLTAWLQAANASQTTLDDYESHRLQLGVPDGVADMQVDKSLLLPYGFEDLHGVDFAKGCYVGQEVTARIKYKNQGANSLYRITRTSGDLPEPFTPITFQGAASGMLCSHNNEIGLALLKTEQAEQALKEDLRFDCGTASLRGSAPPWRQAK